MTKVGVLNENARISRRFWRKLISLRSILADYNCSMFCCTLLNIHSTFAIILMGKRGPVALLSLSFWCLVSVVWFFLAVPWVCLQFMVVVTPDHTHFLFSIKHTAHTKKKSLHKKYNIRGMSVKFVYKSYLGLISA